jgi:hypothetical protein
MARLFVSPEDYSILSKNNKALGVLTAMIEKELTNKFRRYESQIELISEPYAATGIAYFYDDSWRNNTTSAIDIEWIRSI